jgi:glutathione S-transferase
MKLYYTNTSPYARKVRMVLIAKGLEDRLEQVFQNPFEENLSLTDANPLGKVPVLITDDDVTFDSSAICAYLDTLVPQSRLYPEGAKIWPVLTGEAIADGVIDAAFALVMERRRDAQQRSPMWLDRWQTSILRTVDALEIELARPSRWVGDLTIAQIALGAALGYLDFRLADIDWRAERPRLASWLQSFSEHAVMQATTYPQS